MTAATFLFLAGGSSLGSGDSLFFGGFASGSSSGSGDLYLFGDVSGGFCSGSGGLSLFGDFVGGFLSGSVEFASFGVEDRCVRSLGVEGDYTGDAEGCRLKIVSE